MHIDILHFDVSGAEDIETAVIADKILDLDIAGSIDLGLEFPCNRQIFRLEKVNFVFLPSLFSNGIFLQNGKSWVFTYTKKTFSFKDLKDESLDELIEKENVIPKKEKEKDNNMKVYSENKSDAKYITIENNTNIPANQEYEFKFFLKSKKDNKFYFIKTKKKAFKIVNDKEIIIYQLIIDSKAVYSRIIKNSKNNKTIK